MNSVFGIVVSGLLAISPTLFPLDAEGANITPQSETYSYSYRSARDLTDDEIVSTARQMGIESVKVIPGQSFTDIDIQDGNEETANVTTRSSRGYSCAAPAGATMRCSDRAAHISNSFQLGYSWWAQTNSNANVTGIGYQWGRETWRGGGNGKSGSFVVPWYTSAGNGHKVSVAANKSVRVRSMNPPAGTWVIWR